MSTERTLEQAEEPDNASRPDVGSPPAQQDAGDAPALTCNLECASGGTCTHPVPGFA